MSPLCRSNANSISRSPVAFLFLFCFIFVCSNLRRLVHAMILKRPPGEWLGSYRFNFLFQYLLIQCFLALGCYSKITKVFPIDWQINGKLVEACFDGFKFRAYFFNSFKPKNVHWPKSHWRFIFRKVLFHCSSLSSCEPLH